MKTAATLRHLFRRPLQFGVPLPASATATAVAVEDNVPIFFFFFFFLKGFSSTYTYSTATSSLKGGGGEEEAVQRERKGKGQWLKLPPYSSSINPSLVGKAISRRSLVSDTSTTALKWVLQCCPHLPRSLVQKLFRLRQVRREVASPTAASCLETPGQQTKIRRVSGKDVMNLGDRIFLPASVKELPSMKNDQCCNEDEINYMHSLELYKDPAIIVVNKPPGMPVQGGIGITKSLDELAAASLRYDCSENPRLVHRLDRDCSGVLVMGRTQTSATVLHSIFREKTFGASSSRIDNAERILQRKYWALVIGTPRRAKGLISAPLAKVVMDNGKSERIMIANDSEVATFQHAITEYEVIESSDFGYTWLELHPLTGRKHQLRVHCAEALGTPIVGDYKYGWQSHRKWKPLTWSKLETHSERIPKLKPSFGLKLEGGSVAEKKPHLHLHCREMVLPNVSLALQRLQSSTDPDFSNLERLTLVAPLPPHMQRSWEILMPQKVT
ncbi:hypothetical protein MRB53_017378 [Persea americana]|uniref:Uncharacterized protein n=1 Tax=Persea americana TaxID=3435 RepID=A0ACC2M4Z7_PERAE|nr:hypothetical protein MRB53_017378 [Persea americana]